MLLASRLYRISVESTNCRQALRLVATVGILTITVTGLGAPRAIADSEANIDSYDQVLMIEFASDEAAQNADIRLERLFDGYHRAVSCRWDDNWTSDNEATRDLMEEFGIRGTWYLNGQFFHPGGQSADYLPVARKLLAGGNSIGGHSLTHPYLTYFHSNRMFAETSGVRINWEAALDEPIVSYAYSFVDLKPLPEGNRVLDRSLQSLERAGVYHVAEFLNFFDEIKLRLELSPIMPPENQPYTGFAEAVDWAYNDEDQAERWPMISNSMHAWYGTERLDYQYDELGKRLKKLSELENVWHCNQNQYAAYRRQATRAKLEVMSRQGKTVEVTVRERPLLLDLNDATPLTICVEGVAPNLVTSVKCTTASVQSSKRSTDGKRWFHVSHDRGQQLPAKIGHVANPDNFQDVDQVESDADFPNLKGVLFAEGDRLKLHIECEGEDQLGGGCVTWRVPIGWQQPARADLGREIATVDLGCPLQPTDREPDRVGRAHFVAQVDFRMAGEQGRLYFTCEQPGPSPDASYPLDNFSLLGPIPRDQFDVDRFAEQVEADGCPEYYQLGEGGRARWRKGARDGYVTHSWLNPEYVRTMGTWDADVPSFVMRSKVVSPTERAAKLIVSQVDRSVVLLNGRRVEGDQVELRAGENELIVIYPGGVMQSMNDRLCACFVRIANTATGERMEDISYQAY